MYCISLFYVCDECLQVLTCVRVCPQVLTCVRVCLWGWVRACARTLHMCVHLLKPFTSERQIYGWTYLHTLHWTCAYVFMTKCMYVLTGVCKSFKVETEYTFGNGFFARNFCKYLKKKKNHFYIHWQKIKIALHWNFV